MDIKGGSVIELNDENVNNVAHALATLQGLGWYYDHRENKEMMSDARFILESLNKEPWNPPKLT